MLIEQSPLVVHIARLRTSAAQAAPAWLPATLHALLVAVLTRLFGRVEHMIQLWQSGQLPPLQPHQPRARPARPAARHTARGTADAGFPRRALITRAHPPTPIPISRPGFAPRSVARNTPARDQPARHAPQCVIRPPPPSARAPPAPSVAAPPMQPWDTCDFNIPIS